MPSFWMTVSICAIGVRCIGSLDEYDEVRERRNQLRHPNYEKPELIATGPNQVWSWDITKLLGLVKWTYYYLYVILDIYSRYVVGWMIAPKETTTLAQELVQQTYEKQGIQEDELPCTPIEVGR
jgi:putative transposase